MATKLELEEENEQLKLQLDEALNENEQLKLQLKEKEKQTGLKPKQSALKYEAGDVIEIGEVSVKVVIPQFIHDGRKKNFEILSDEEILSFAENGTVCKIL